MNLLSSRVEIGDIKDAEAFVRACIRRARLRVPQQEMEDTVALGLLCLVRLHQLYDPLRETGRVAPRVGGRDGDRTGVASFAGYAHYLLPNKIRDAWHQMHPEHLLVTQDDGKRRYVYGESPKSLDEVNRYYDDPESEVIHRGSIDHPRTRHVGDFVRA